MLEFQWFVKYTVHRNQCLLHCRILSVFFTLQDTNMSLLHSPLGSGAVCSSSIQCSFFPHPNDVAHRNTCGKHRRAPEYSCTHGKCTGKFKVLEDGKHGKALEFTGTKLATSVHLPSLCSSFRKAPDCSISSISSMWPHIGRQSLSPTITFGYFHSPLGQQPEHAGFISRGVTAVVHGC